MAKPSATSTAHPLPFDRLSPDDFERLCLALVEREGYLRVQHTGRRGDDGGRDISAYLRTGNGSEKLWYFQCKRYQTINASTLKKEVKKIDDLAAGDPSLYPAGIVFMISAPVNARTRDAIIKHCQGRYKCEVWCDTDLDSRVNKYPELIKQFFGVGVSSAIPLEIPAPPPDFTGRETEIKELVAEINRSGGIGITGLRGMGGIGKTVLAEKLAELLAPNFPDGQLYMDLKGASDAPVLSVEAQAHVIRSFERAAQIPERSEDVDGLYRSILSGKKALLLMDNASDAAQIRPLLPPPGCALIVTSRHNFTVPGLTLRNLDELSPDEARDLLLKIEPRIAEHADEIAELCGRLPLALRASASLLAVTPGLSPTEYCARLKNELARLTEIGAEGVEIGVEASLELSYHALSDASAQVLRQMSVFPGGFDADAEAAICQDEGNRTLAEIERRSLVQFDPKSARYRLHDLVRVFASGKANAEERSETEQRHAAYYVLVLHWAHSLYEQGGEATLRGLGRYDQEWINIRAGQAWACNQPSENSDALAICSAYPNAGVYLLMLRQHPRERIRWLEAALNASRILKDRTAEAPHLSNLGNAYYALGDYRRAIDYYQQGLTIAREIGDLRGEGSALGNIGTAYYNLGDYDKSLEYHQQSLPLKRRIGDRRGEGNSLGNLGNDYHSLGNYDRAIKYHRGSLAIAREIGDLAGEEQSIAGIGNAYHSLGAYRHAIEYHEKALAIAQQIGDRLGEAQHLNNLGIAYEALGDYRGAIPYHEKALAITRLIGDRLGEGIALGNMGVAYENLGEHSRAVAYHQQHARISRETGNRIGEANALWNMSLAYVSLGELEKAITAATKALNLYEAIKSPNVGKVRSRLAQWRATSSADS